MSDTSAIQTLRATVPDWLAERTIAFPVGQREDVPGQAGQRMMRASRSYGLVVRLNSQRGYSLMGLIVWKR